MNKFTFKCAEDPDHVAKANITQAVFLAALNFFVHYKIELDCTYEEYKMRSEEIKHDLNAMHDLSHQLADNILRIYDFKEGTVLHEHFFKPYIDGLRKQQEECRGA